MTVVRRELLRPALSVWRVHRGTLLAWRHIYNIRHTVSAKKGRNCAQKRSPYPRKTHVTLARMCRFLLPSVLALNECAVTHEAVKVGPDTYQVSAVAAPARGGVAGAEQMAVARANKKCDSLGKEIAVTNVETGHEFPAAGRAVVTFTCK